MSMGPDVVEIDAERLYVKEWANKIAVADNDIIQLRKKNGIIYVMKIEPFASNTWSRLDPLDEPVFTDQHGVTLESSIGNLPAGTGLGHLSPEVEAASEPIPEISEGWYQDDKANLYKYEGLGSWDAPMKEWRNLLKLADSGMLEYIG